VLVNAKPDKRRCVEEYQSETDNITICKFYETRTCERTGLWLSHRCTEWESSRTHE